MQVQWDFIACLQHALRGRARLLRTLRARAQRSCIAVSRVQLPAQLLRCGLAYTACPHIQGNLKA